MRSTIVISQSGHSLAICSWKLWSVKVPERQSVRLSVDAMQRAGTLRGEARAVADDGDESWSRALVAANQALVKLLA